MLSFSKRIEEDDLTSKKAVNNSLEDWKRTWMGKVEKSIFISTLQSKIGLSLGICFMKKLSKYTLSVFHITIIFIKVLVFW